MTVPTIGRLATDLYTELEPFAFKDGDGNGWPVATVAGGIGAMLQPLDDLAADTDDGPGWSQVLDIDRCPTAWLPWLAQFPGATVNPLFSDEDQRNQIRVPAGHARGTNAAIAAAAQPYLTGSKTVVFRERDPVACPSWPAYGLTVFTFTDETPDSTTVETVLKSASVKPIGIVLNYEVVDGLDFEAVRTGYTTFAVVKGTFTTFDDLRLDRP